ncbi:helix-turn-helix transcriptional regulator [Liquorilactobacillus nagelii]|uniref:helix-turn-helix transcriptional regulator n=1 Tax=Liquorilactobacillus nagelii TaxID=82688 RepID=UPI001CCDEA46|nr:helix-turn-helix transcriptional regulator [Liquorilactobacillus nagelii]ULQ49023.1 helix-turn-helix domain-containing protein [Liquorilactobacillus nagelii]
MEIQKHFKVTLRGLRATYGLSQKEAAEAIGVGLETWRNYERGITSPDEKKLRVIEKVFNISYNDIIFCRQLRLNRNKVTE